MNSAALIAADQARLWHPFTQMKAWTSPDHEPLILVEGDGALLRDSEGREYIDGNSSIWTNIHGHRHPKITAAIKEQLDRVAHVSFLGTSNVPAIELAEKLLRVFGGGDCTQSSVETGGVTEGWGQPPLSRVFYSDDGSTAVEVALKMSLQYWQLVGQPQRTRFLAFDRAYHGDTAGASSLGGVRTFTDRFSAVHFPVQHVADVVSLNEVVADQVAAVIIEPLVQGAAGIRLWPSGMLKELRAWCDANGVLLIFDEVLTGFGRTGRMFACHHENVMPDFLCLAKGLTGGYLPLAATLITERIYDAFLGEYSEQKTFFYGHSYCGNPLGCAAALASLAIFEEEKTLEVLQPKIELLRGLLSGLRDSLHVAEIRQCGFIAGVELRQDMGMPYPASEQMGNRVCRAARKHGLLTRPILDTIVLMPPLCTSEGQIHAAVDALRQAIGEVCSASNNN